MMKIQQCEGCKYRGTDYGTPVCLETRQKWEPILLIKECNKKEIKEKK